MNYPFYCGLLTMVDLFPKGEINRNCITKLKNKEKHIKNATSKRLPVGLVEN